MFHYYSSKCLLSIRYFIYCSTCLRSHLAQSSLALPETSLFHPTPALIPFHQPLKSDMT